MDYILIQNILSTAYGINNVVLNEKNTITLLSLSLYYNSSIMQYMV